MSDTPSPARSLGPEFLAVALVATVLAFATLWWTQSAKPHSPAPAEVRAVLDAQVAAWNRGDLEGFMAGYWNSDDLTFCSGGTVTKGWRPTLDRYRKRYQADGKEMGRLTFDDVQVEPLTGDVALVRGRWKLTLTTGSPDGLFTLEVKRLPEGWRVVYDHTSEEKK